MAIWFILNVGFALTPMILQMNLRQSAGLPMVTSDNVPDFAFLSVMLCVVAANDVIKDPGKNTVADTYTIIWISLIFFAVLSTGLLAEYDSQAIPGPGMASVKNFYLMESKWLAVLIICGTTGIEYLLAGGFGKGASKK